MPSDIRRRGSDLLELELQLVVNHHVGAGNQTQVLSKTASGLTARSAISPARFVLVVFAFISVLKWTWLSCLAGVSVHRVHA